MTEVRLNSVAVSNLHQQKIDSIDVKQLMKEFLANSCASLCYQTVRTGLLSIN